MVLVESQLPPNLHLGRYSILFKQRIQIQGVCSEPPLMVCFIYLVWLCFRAFRIGQQCIKVCLYNHCKGMAFTVYGL